MKRLFSFIIIVLFAAIALVWITKVPLSNRFLDRSLPLESKISSLNPWIDKTDIGDFYMKNVKDSKMDHALDIGLISANYNYSDLIGDKIIIEEVHIKDMKVAFEIYNITGSKSNWSLISEILSESAATEAKGKPFLIKRVIIENLELNSYNKFLGGEITTKNIERLEFENIGSDQPLPKDKIISLFLSSITDQIFQLPQVDDILKNVLKEPGKILENPGGFLDSINPFN